MQNLRAGTGGSCGHSTPGCRTERVCLGRSCWSLEEGLWSLPGRGGGLLGHRGSRPCEVRERWGWGGEDAVGRAGSSWHLLPMALWHWSAADEGLPELLPYPRSPQGLAHSGCPKSRAGAGKGRSARAGSQELCVGPRHTCKLAASVNSVTGEETEAQKGKVTCPGSHSYFSVKATPGSSAGLGCCRRRTMTAWEKEGHILAEERASERACCGLQQQVGPNTASLLRSALGPSFPCPPPRLFISGSSHSQALTVCPLVKAGGRDPLAALTLSSWVTLSKSSIRL